MPESRRAPSGRGRAGRLMHVGYRHRSGPRRRHGVHVREVADQAETAVGPGGAARSGPQLFARAGFRATCAAAGMPGRSHAPHESRASAGKSSAAAHPARRAHRPTAHTAADRLGHNMGMSGVEHNVTDPYLWLEEVTDERALDWARAHNDVVARRFAATERFARLEQRILDMLDTDTKIAYPGRRGRWLYNFWRDADHPRGLWRRTTFEEYASPAPRWDVLIDLDALAEAEGENWVWGGAAVLRPEQHRALISL